MSAASSLSIAATQAARHHAGRTCLTFGERRWSFAQFWHQVELLAGALAAQLSAGARIGLYMANRPEYLLLQCALERAGLVRVPLNRRSTPHELRALLTDCDASAVFFDAHTERQADEVSLTMPSLWWCQVDRATALGGPAWNTLLSKQQPLPPFPDLESLSSINYTSGTSGTPKGVMLTHRNWSALTRNMLIDRDIRREDRFGHVGPLTHSSGAYFLPWFLRGACSVLIEDTSTSGLLASIGSERLTVFTCVPTVLTRIVNDPAACRHDLTSLRAIGYGAEPIPFNTLEKALTLFGPILTQNYGLTEAMMTVATLPPTEHFTRDASGEPTAMARAGCIGRPYTFVEVVLRDAQGHPVPIGGIGELTIRSEHMSAGYWQRPQESAQALRDGWLWSGDLARCDREGFLTLVGRSKDMLISGGYNIYPAELEAVLTNHPDVVEAAVFGVPHRDWGEIPVAFIAALPQVTLTPEQIQAYCRPLLGLRTPRRVTLMASLPKNANGKIDKPALKRQALELFGDAGAGSV